MSRTPRRPRATLDARNTKSSGDDHKGWEGPYQDPSEQRVFRAAFDGASEAIRKAYAAGGCKLGEVEFLDMVGIATDAAAAKYRGCESYAAFASGRKRMLDALMRA